METSGDVWETVLAACKVRPGEKVVVLAGNRTDEQNAAAAMRALRALGAHAARLEAPAPALSPRVVWGNLAPYHMPALSGNRMIIECLKAADMVIDMVGMDRGDEQKEILASGTRVLLVREGPATLQRLISGPDDKRRVCEAATRLRAAKVMRVVSDAGTDFRAPIGQYPLLVQYGLADEPGRWDHWPSAFVATWPDEGAANGTIVLDRGDIILPFKDYVRTRIRLTIRDGYIQAIDGEFDADYLREYMAIFNDREGYAVSHIGWGLLPQAQWAALGLFDKVQSHGMDARSFLGNFMFSTGPNGEAGGTRDPYCHLDMPMRNCTVFLDDDMVVSKGKVVGVNS